MFRNYGARVRERADAGALVLLRSREKPLDTAWDDEPAANQSVLAVVMDGAGGVRNTLRRAGRIAQPIDTQLAKSICHRKLIDNMSLSKPAWKMSIVPVRK